MFRLRWQATILLAAVIIAASISFYYSNITAKAADSSATAPYTTWSAYGGGVDSAQYSALTQINKSNVSQLQQVWFYPSVGNGFRFGSNPIVAGNTMFVVGKDNNVIALDAATGKELWMYVIGGSKNISHRGLSYWESKDRKDCRVLFAANDMLQAVDARTGKIIPSFGDHGMVDLRVGISRDPKLVRRIQSGTPGRVFENLILMGSAPGEEYESPPGDLRAYDVITGKMLWVFHTVPLPGEFGYETWPKDAWKYIGGTNDWAEIAVDEKRGIAYFPLGSPTYDFYGADRHGANLFSDCLLALDARTGKYLWHYQTTHHDLWDYDLEAAPKLLTIKHDGKMVDVLAQAGKNGFLYVLDRVTGKPIWPIEERPVPQSTMPGEQSWPTQPFPTVIPPFARQKFSPDEVNPHIADPKEREKIRAEVAASHNEGIYTPVSTENTMSMPGNNGGANWGTTASDPSNGMFYVLSKEAPSMIKLEPKRPRREMRGPAETQGQLVYLQNCQQCHLVTLKGQPPGIPSLIGVVNKVGAKKVEDTVRNGAAPMPGFPDLTPDDIQHVIAYLSHPEKGTIPPDMIARILAPPPPSLVPETGTRYWSAYGYMNSTENLPAISPPWSTITAYDLNNGAIKWQMAPGNVTELLEKGIKGTGSYWPRGGPVVTASGLIILGTLSDSMLHVYDSETGKLIWETKVPGRPEGIPAVYEVAGREYIAISASASVPSSAKNPASSAAAGGAAEGAEGPLRPTVDTEHTQGYYVYALPQ